MTLTYGSEEWEDAYQEILQARLKEQTKPYIMGTPEWVDAYEKLVQGDAEYREAAAGWEGTVVIHTLAEPSIGMDEDSYMLMDLWHGDCRKMRPAPRGVGESADYVITGPYQVWKQANKAEIDTNKAMMQGKLKLKGNLATIVRYVQASTRLTQLSSQMEARFPDEISPEELDELKRFNDELKEKLQ